MGPGRYSSLRIGGDSSVVSGSGRTGGASDSLTEVVVRNASGQPPFPLDKGKGRIDEIKYPGGSEYLKLAVQNALYRPPFGVQVLSPDILTSYVVQVPKMVCFFEMAFDNGLHFPLYPFIKRVLQHFNVCPSKLSPNF